MEWRYREGACTQQAADGLGFRENAATGGGTIDIRAEQLQQVCASEFAPVKLREVAKRQHGLIGLKHEFGRPGKRSASEAGQDPPVVFQLQWDFLGKCATKGGFYDAPVVQ